MTASRDEQEAIREGVLELLHGDSAHVSLKRAVAGLPADQRGARPAGQPHTPWRLVEHIRRAQRDIVDFILDPGYESPPWPEGYWPGREGPGSARAWEKSLVGFERDADRLRELVADPGVDLLKPIAHGQGQTILREAMLVIDHTGYHVGQLIVIRRMLGSWA